MSSQRPNSQDGYKTPPPPRQTYNPSFRDGSMERHEQMPLHGTEYNFAGYGYPDRIEAMDDCYPLRGQSPQRDRPESVSPSAPKRIPTPRTDVFGYAAGGDNRHEARRIPQPVSELSTGGQYVVHRRHTTGNRFQGNVQQEPEIEDDLAMENLLNKLPSRQLEVAALNAARTMKRKNSRRKSVYGTLKHGFVARGLEDLIDDTALDPEEEMQMEEVIRSIPATMAARRSLIRKLSSRKRKAPSLMKRAKYSFGMWWKHFKEDMADLRYTLQLWHTHLKKIEGNFGTDVLSYFVFLKWLLLINIPTLLLTLGFIVIPQVLFRWFQQEPPGYSSEIAFTGLELLTGEGWFRPTELYYGYYTNGSIKLEGSYKDYQMQLAYLFTCGGYYLLTLFILGHSILRSYRKFYIEAGGVQSMQIVFKIIGSWDFGLTSSEAIKLKQKSTCNEIKEYLFGFDHQRNRRKGFRKQCSLFGLRLFTNFFILGISAGATYLVYFMSITVYEKNFNEEANITTTTVAPTTPANVNVTQVPSQGVGTQASDAARNPLLLMALPLAIGAIHLILPIIFSYIEEFEQYDDPKTSLYVHLVRSLLLRMGTMSMLLYYWYSKVADQKDNRLKCWETYVGQDLYRLVIVDFIFTLIGTFFSDFVRSLIANSFGSVKHPTFGIGRNTLELIYSQALCWIGTFYAPLLSVIVILKLILIFYVKMISVLRNCKPSARPWRATQTHTVFLGFLFVFFLGSTASVTIGIIFIKPSPGCGPYQGKDQMYSVVPELVTQLEETHEWLGHVIDFVSSPGFIAFILVVFGTGVYLVRTIMIGRKETVQRLKQQLVLEGKDKTFLLNLLNHVNQGDGVGGGGPIGLPYSGSQMELSDDGVSGSGRVFVRQVAEGSPSFQ